MGEAEANKEFQSVIVSKRNTGWRRKDPINLKTLALQYVIKAIDHFENIKNEELKNWMLENFTKSMPMEIFTDLINYAKKSFLKPGHLVSIFEVVPASVYIKELDFLRNYQGTHTCSKDNMHLWVNGVSTDHLVRPIVLKRLFDLVKGEDKTQIRKIAIWTHKDTVTQSSFPHIIAKSVNLTILTIRGDASDHILRIIGLNCDTLKFLDVSRSPKITHQGLHNLVLKFRKDKNPIVAPKNKIVKSLNSVSVTIGQGGTLTRENVFSFGQFFNSSIYYIQCDVPEYIVKVERDRESIKIPMSLDECFGETDKKLLEDIQSLIPFDPENPDEVEIDSFKLNDKQFVLKMFNKETRLLLKALKVELGHGIVEFYEYWESGAWNLLELADITDLATKISNVKKLECRIVGPWDENWGKLFPKLEELNCWCLENCTKSILKYCPALRVVNIRHVPDPNTYSLLTHQDLIEILEGNTVMKSSLEEFIVRPTSLTGPSILELYRQCPNIKRIGDLESWNIEDPEIDEINKLLYNENSQCVLVILDYPPPI